jgi:hypothetical protein
MNLPTEKECLAYFEEFKVPGNIKEHCIKVQEVSIFLARELKKSEVAVNINLVSAVAVLHDLFKPVAIENFKPYPGIAITSEQLTFWADLRKKYSGNYENEIAYEFFKDKFPKLAISLRDACDPDHREKTWEEKIVHYVDWRISEEKIISLVERMDILEKRYPNEKKWKVFREIATDIEIEIFSQLNFVPDQLGEKMKNE